MNTIIPLALAFVLITIASLRYRLPPFLSLVGTSIVFGLLAGLPAETVITSITGGAGRIFATLGVVIFCGVNIAQVFFVICFLYFVFYIFLLSYDIVFYFLCFFLL